MYIIVNILFFSPSFLTASSSGLTKLSSSFSLLCVRSHYTFPKHQQCSVAYFAAQRRENDEDNFVRPLDDAVKKLGEKNKMLTIMYMFNTAYCVKRILSIL
jgi:hypothetical protein